MNSYLVYCKCNSTAECIVCCLNVFERRKLWLFTLVLYVVVDAVLTMYYVL